MNQIDRFFASQLTGYHVEPSSAAREEIEVVINMGQRRKVWTRIAVAASISLVVILSSILIKDMNSIGAAASSAYKLSISSQKPQTKPESDLQLTKSPIQVDNSKEATESSLGKSKTMAEHVPIDQVAQIISKPGVAISQLRLKTITMKKHPLPGPVTNAEVPSPSVAIIYKRSKLETQAVAEAEPIEHNSKFHQWLSKANDWREGEITLPTLGEVAGSLFAKDSKKPESKTEIE